MDGARAVIIGRCYEKALREPLEGLGLEVLLCPPNPVVDARLACHADLSLFRMDGNRILVARQAAAEAFLQGLSDIGLEPIICEGPKGESYPLDAAMCAALAGGLVFHNPGISCPEIVEWAGDRFVPVRQGYAKCAMCPVGEGSAITADPGVAAAAENAGLDVLKITQGHIELEGFDYGFIGGSAACLNDTVAFTGRLDGHPDRDRILDFIYKRGKSPLFLTEKNIFDVGSMIII